MASGTGSLSVVLDRPTGVKAPQESIIEELRRALAQPSTDPPRPEAESQPTSGSS